MKKKQSLNLKKSEKKEHNTYKGRQMEIEHDGKKYILKSQVESIIKDRVSKVAQRATEAESSIKELQLQLVDQKNTQASYDVLLQQVEDLQNQLSMSKNKFSRYMSMSKHGITDQELIDVIEWQYNRSMSDVPKKEQKTLEEWFSLHMNNPDEAPITLRPHLKSLTTEESKEAIVEAPKEADTVLDNDSHVSYEGIQHREYMEAPQAPVTNKGAVPPPEGKDILKRAFTESSSFYNENHDAIRKAWFARYGRK